MKQEKIHYSHQNLRHDIKRLKQMIEQIENPHLVCLYRGSMGVGLWLSNIMDLPLSVVDFQTRDNQENKEPHLMKNAGISATQTLVVIDDIYDIGLTMNHTREMLFKEFPHNKMKGFCLYANGKNKHLHKNYDPWVTCLNESNGEWISFYWEEVPKYVDL